MSDDSGIPLSRSSGWRRLSPWSVVFILAAGIVRFVRENIPLLLGAGVGAAAFERIGVMEVALAGGLLLAVGTTISIIYYRRFRFRLEGDMLRVQKGLIERKELKLQAGRIQHISFQQPVYMRPFRLVRFSVDTPGSTAAEVELPGIRWETAEFLRTQLQSSRESDGRKGETETDSAGESEASVLFRVTPWNLTLHGVASNYAYVMAAALSPFIHRIEQSLAERIGEVDLWERIVTATGSALAAGVVLVFGLVVLMVTISVVVSWLRFHGFVLTRGNGRFTQRSGLLNRQEQVLSLSKLQAVESIQTAVGRMIRRRHLVCRQIGVAAMENDAGARTFLVPGLTRDPARRLSGEFLPDVNPDVSLRRVHPFYRRFLMLRFGLLFTAVFGTFAAAIGEAILLAGFLGVLLILWLLVYQHWRTVGWTVDRRYAYFRSGLFGHRLMMFPSRNAQRAELSQSWFQRRRGVATVRLSLPSGTVTFPFLPEAEARFLANLTMYRVESGRDERGKEASEPTSPERGGQV